MILIITRKILSLNIGALIAIGALVSVTSCSKKSFNTENNQVRIASWGGQFQEDLVKTWIEPAAIEAKIELSAEAWDADYGALATRIRRGLETPDLIHVESQFVAGADSEKMFRQLPSKIFDGLVDEMKKSEVVKARLAIPVLQYGYIVAYQSELGESLQKEPNAWAAFWDTAKYPGKRGLRDFPIGNIEAALLALGHDPKMTLYAATSEIDLGNEVRAALDQLSKIRSDVIWWSRGDQLQRGLADGSMRLAGAWSGRVLSAYRQQKDEQRPSTVGILEHSALVSTDWWVLSQTARNPEAAIKLLEAMYAAGSLNRPKAFRDSQGYAIPVQIERPTIQQDPLGVVAAGSAANAKATLQINDVFWSKNFDWINAKWREWRTRSN